MTSNTKHEWDTYAHGEVSCVKCGRITAHDLAEDQGKCTGNRAAQIDAEIEYCRQLIEPAKREGRVTE